MGNIGISPGSGGHVILDGGIFSRQTKRIPAHRLQHMITPQLVETCQHIANGVIAYMAHMQLAGWVGKHRQAVIFGLISTFRRCKGAACLPVALNIGFYCLGLVVGVHLYRVI